MGRIFVDFREISGNHEFCLINRVDRSSVRSDHPGFVPERRVDILGRLILVDF